MTDVTTERARPVFRGWVTAWFDLVGMAEAIAELDRLTSPVTDEEKQAIIERAARPIDTMGEVFRRLLAGWTERTDRPARMNSAPARLRELYDDVFKLRLRVDSVGDGIAASVPIDGPAPEVAVGLLVRSVAWTFVAMLSVGQPGRAAIEIGMGEVIPGGTFVSSSWVKAYRLEARAEWPRVLLGADLVHALQSWANGQFGRRVEPEIIRVRQYHAREILGWARPAASHREFAELNYLHPEVSSLDVVGSAEIIQNAHRYLMRSERDLEAAGRPKHAGYHRMAMRFMRDYWPTSVARIDDVS